MVIEERMMWGWGWWFLENQIFPNSPTCIWSHLWGCTHIGFSTTWNCKMYTWLVGETIICIWADCSHLIGKSNKIQHFLLLGRLFSSDLIVVCVAERNVLFKGRVGFVLNQHPYYCFRRMNGWGEHCVWGATESRNCVSEIFIFTFNILLHQMHFRSNLI